jgi:ADP-ribose pyrophosphatase YjhB (NUDIX family)
MPGPEGTRERVEERLVALEDAFSDFPVNQTTLAVAREVYERAAGRSEGGVVDAYVRVYDPRGDVLVVDGADGWGLPRCEPGPGERVVAGTERALRERTGVDCAVTGLARVTILGVRDGDDPERPPVYRLVAVFTAETDHEPPAVPAPGEPVPDGALAGGDHDGARWQVSLPDAALPPH